MIPNTTYTYYLTSFGGFGETAGSNTLSATTGGKGLPEPPTIFALKSSGTDSISIFWDEPKDTTNFVSYEIERRIQDKEAFSTIASVSVGTVDFTDTKLTQGLTYTYRISSTNDVGTGKPSNEVSGVASVDTTVLDSAGKTLEPDAQNKFSKEESEVISQTIEMFNVQPDIIDTIISDLDSNKINAYQVIEKMLDGSYGTDQELIDAGKFYGANYIDTNDLQKFLKELEKKVAIAIGGSDGKGDNPRHGICLRGLCGE